MLIAENARLLISRVSKLADMDTIGERIAKSRAQRALTQSELARRIGVTPSAINQIESGATKFPRPELLFAIADALEVDARELTFGEKVAQEAWDKAIFKLIDDLPEGPKQEILDFTMYKIERAQDLVAAEKLPRYLTMIEKIKQDMTSKKKPR